MDSFKKEERKRFRFGERNRFRRVVAEVYNKQKSMFVTCIIFCIFEICMLVGFIVSIALKSWGFSIFVYLGGVGGLFTLIWLFCVVPDIKDAFRKIKGQEVDKAVENVTGQYDIAKEHNDCESKFYDLLLEYAPQAEDIRWIRWNILSTRKRDLRQERKDGIRKDPYENYLLGIIQMSKVKNALYYFLSASDDGWIPATYEAGKCYFYGGMGVRRNFKKAAKYFKECVEQESSCYQSVTYAKLYLADQYFWGLGVAKDINKANILYREIVDYQEKGHEYALLRLERTQVPCPICGGDGARIDNGKYKCEICKHTFELTEDMNAPAPDVTLFTIDEISQKCSKTFISIKEGNEQRTTTTETKKTL